MRKLNGHHESDAMIASLGHTKEIHMLLRDCFTCPYSLGATNGATYCTHPETQLHVIEKPREPGCIPDWCKLRSVDVQPSQTVALRTEILTSEQLTLAILAELLRNVQDIGRMREVVELTLEAERRLKASGATRDL